MFTCLAVSLICTLAASCGAAAQDPQNQGRRGGGRGGDLTQNDKVQADLKLTDDQKEQIKKIIADAPRPMRDPNLSREERMAKAQEARKDLEDKINTVLNDSQKVRIKEIRLQARGVQALSDKAVAESLKLSDDQVNKIKDLNKSLADARSAAFQGGGRPDQDAIDKLTKLRTETNDKILAVLTPDQKASFEKMQGAKIEGLPTGGFGGGFGGGRRGGGGGGGGN
jgi:Spy/CpxP family protein refolding chaperone